MNITGKRKGIAKVVTIVGVIILVLGVVVAGFYFADKKGLLNLKQEGSETSAIFLTNGQVYLGKILRKNGSYVILKDVYYLQTSKQEEGATEGTGTSKISMKPIALTETVLGTTSKIEISRENVLYIQKLREDSKILQVIQEGGTN